MIRHNSLKKKLAAGHAVYGTWLNLASPLVAELAGRVGYDAVLIDGEHGPGDHSDHRAMIQAAMATDATVLMRVAANDPVFLKRALDLGVEGVMIPAIGSAEAARDAVAACLYPPHGRRGFAAGLLRASAFGLNLTDYVAEVGGGTALFLALQIETAAGVDAVEAIAAVPGYDCLFIGPYDLSGDLGIAGQFDHPMFDQALSRIEAAGRDHGKILGCLPFPGMPLARLEERGYRFLMPGSDVGFLRQAMQADVAGFRRHDR